MTWPHEHGYKHWDVEATKGKISHESVLKNWSGGWYQEWELYILILAGFDTFNAFQTAHRDWINSTLKADSMRRREKWTESLAVGGNKFINDILSQMGFRANGRKIIEKGQALQIREEIQSYNPLFESQNGIIAPKNTMVWQQYTYE